TDTGRRRTPWGAMSVAAERRDGPVADFCAALRRLQLDSGLARTALARQVNYSKSQLYAILDGQIRRPPEWDRVVEPLVRACTGDDERAVDYWRRRHGELLEVYELSSRDRHPAATAPSQPARVVPAQLPADVDVFTGRGAGAGRTRRRVVHRPDCRGRCDRGGDLGGVGYRRGGQDRVGDPVGASRSGRVPRRAAPRQPTRLRP
ncbi:MAG: helix-turn-helix domain-containing protein, partial [Pseudonocardiaceae bacterium]